MLLACVRTWYGSLLCIALFCFPWTEQLVIYVTKQALKQVRRLPTTARCLHERYKSSFK